MDVVEGLSFFKVFAWIQAYLQAEAEVYRAKWSEPDRRTFRRRVRSLRTYFAHGAKVDIDRPIRFDVSEHGGRGESVIPRPVLKVKSHEHPELGVLYRFFIGIESRDTPEAMHYMLAVAQVPEKGLRIVSVYYFCRECTATGKVEAATCSTCDGRAFVHESGLELATLGPLVEERDIHPTVERLMPAYRANPDW